MTMRIERLAGLPGEGPHAKHCHLGYLALWSEGYVVRFTDTSGASWVGNFQEGYSYFSDVVAWPEAQIFIIIAAGACSVVSAADIDRYSCYQTTVTETLFNEDRTRLFIADYCDVCAYDCTGTIIWKRENLGVDGVTLKACTTGFITGSACYDPPEGWEDFRVCETDGTAG
jgi:hypothetical protein